MLATEGMSRSRWWSAETWCSSYLAYRHSAQFRQDVLIQYGAVRHDAAGL